METPDSSRQRGAQAQTGYALMIVLVFASGLLLTWGAMFSYMRSSDRWAAVDMASRQASWSARAGLVHGLFKVTRGTTTSTVVTTPLGGLSYTVTQAIDGTDTVLSATGTYGGYVVQSAWSIPTAAIEKAVKANKK
jgi:hypothetical protein